MADSERLQIGEVAKRSDVSVETIRYYEKIGLIREPERFESSGYRAFDPGVIDRLENIKRFQDLGLTLEEIGRIYNVDIEGESSLEEVSDLANEKLEEVDRKIKNLEGLRDQLSSLSEVDDPDEAKEILAQVRGELDQEDANS